MFDTSGSGTIESKELKVAFFDATKVLDASGEAAFTTQVKVGDSLAVWVYGASGKAFMNNINTFFRRNKRTEM